MAKRWMNWLCFGLLLFGSGNIIVAATLVPLQASWHYLKGTNEASAPLSAWRQAGFDDEKWSLGSAPFHYGDGLTEGTAFNDMRNKYSSIFLRRDFAILSLSNYFLSLRLLSNSLNGHQFLCKYFVPEN
jgi:hypothetical protein